MWRAVTAKIGRVVSGTWTAWVVLGIAVAVTGLLIAVGGSPQTQGQESGLPATAESAKVAAMLKQMPGGQATPALIVYTRDGQPLTAADEQAILADSAALSGSPPIFSAERAAALVTVPVPPGPELPEAVKQLRESIASDLPSGMTAQVSGGAGFAADIASSFDGANTTLLLTTVGVVAILLLITYRSPWLWLVPLAVVGAADLATNATLALLNNAGAIDLDPSTVGIVDVLVFGAGTDYALLLIARYREELRKTQDRHEALRKSLTSAGPAIGASALTVCLSLLTLLAAVLSGDRALGVAATIGVAVAAIYALLVLPAALAVCGRGLFWPFIPRYGQPDPTRTGPWHRVGTMVANRPRLVAIGSVLLLAVLALGLSDARLGLSRTEQFRVQAESVDGLQTLSKYFPAGAAEPTLIVARTGQEADVLRAVTETEGVEQARIVQRANGITVINAALAADPGSAASYDTIRALRAATHAVPQAQALVGGEVAVGLDTREAAIASLKRVVPLVLAVVLLVLIVLLRSIVAPLVLVATVVATFFAALGAGNFLFVHVLDYAALDTPVPLLSFLFLVALGVDYNIFLATRAREEAIEHGTKRGILIALAVTGGVITSAGILLAAVFAVLGVLPLVTLTEIGVIVGIGVLLDTLLVRTLLVPALAMLLGRRFWWPSSLSAPPPSPSRSPAGAGAAAGEAQA